jgi:hypothetical protein
VTVTFTRAYGLSQLLATNYSVMGTSGLPVSVLSVLPGNNNRRVNVLFESPLQGGQPCAFSSLAPASAATVTITSQLCASSALSIIQCPPTPQSVCVGQDICLEADFCQGTGTNTTTMNIYLDGSGTPSEPDVAAGPSEDESAYNVHVKYVVNFATAGSHTVKITASDGGTPLECNVTITVNAPVLVTCPATITTNIAGSSVVVNYANPIVSGGALVAPIIAPSM